MNGLIQRSTASRPWEISNAVRAGTIVRLFPGVYADPERAREPAIRRSAAVLYLDGRGALSHSTALDVWRVGWHEPEYEPVHVTVPIGVHLRGAKGLVIHRSLRPGAVHRRGGHPLTPLDRTIVDSWPLLPGTDRIGVLTFIVTSGHVSAARIRQCLKETPRITGAAELRRVLALLGAGCQSPLELWGADQVFDGIPGLRRQFPVGKLHLDVFAPLQKVAFELDGAAFHGDRMQRERDLRRDAFLATLGIQVVRFSYARLTAESAAVRREVLAILAARSSA